jgi:hypothetical protein
MTPSDLNFQQFHPGILSVLLEFVNRSGYSEWQTRLWVIHRNPEQWKERLLWPITILGTQNANLPT